MCVLKNGKHKTIFLTSLAIVQTVMFMFTSLTLATDYTLQVNNASGNEESGKVIFTVSVTPPLANDERILLNFTTSNNTTDPGDVVTASGGYSLAGDGTSSKPLSVIINKDTYVEDDESFFLNLLNPHVHWPVGNTSTVTVVGGSGTGTIIDDDKYQVSVSPSVTAIEGASVEVEFSIDQEPLPGDSVTISYSTLDESAEDGTDYTGISGGTVTFSNGDALSQTIDISTIDESIDEENEQFSLTFVLSSNTQIDNSTVIATIEDDDYTLTYSSVGSGSLVPDSTQGTPAATLGPDSDQIMIDVDTTEDFIVTVDNKMEDLFVDGTPLGAVWRDRVAGTYTYSFNTGDSSTNHLLEAAFRDNLLIEIIEDPDYGEITFPGSYTVNKDGNKVVEVIYGNDITFTVTAANPCPLGLDHNIHVHHISNIKIDDTPLVDIEGEGLTTYEYTFSNVIESHSIQPSFTRYVDVSIHGPGTVETPVITNTGAGIVEESVEIESYQDYTFTMTPESGYLIQKLVIDGTDYGLAGVYSFPEIDADHTLDVFYTVDGFTLEAVSHFNTIYEDAGETTPASILTVNGGDDVSLYVDLNDIDHSVLGILIDNVSVQIPDPGDFLNYSNTISLTNVGGNYLSVAFSNVIASHRLEALDYDKVDLSDIPLDAKLRPNPATIMFVLDDSGSMDWEFATEDGVYDGQYYVYPLGDSAYSGHVLNATQKREWKSQWSGYNRMFYNPTVQYKPWPTFSGSLLEDCDGDATDNIANACLDTPRSHPWDQAPNQNYRLDMNNVFTVISSSGDDYGNSLASATSLSLDQGYAGNIEESGDNDFFKIVLTSQGTLIVRTLRTPDCTDTMAQILDSSGNVFRYGDYGNTNQYLFNPYADDCGSSNYCDTSCGRDTDPYIELTNVPAGTYYIDIRGYGNRTGSYILDLSFTGTSQTFPDPTPASGGATIINAHYYTFNDVDEDGIFDSGEDLYLINITNPVEYYRVDNSQGSDDDLIEANELISVNAVDLPTTVYVKTSPTNGEGTDATSDDFEVVYSLERQNFVNWFSYYRKRELTATAAVSTVIADMESTYVGIATINAVADNLSNYGIRQQAVPIEVSGEIDNKNSLLTTLYQLEIGSYGTPLRRALRNVGAYFDDTDGFDGNLGESPYHNPVAGDECKQSFAIMMTDGYWNGGGPGVGNIDGNNGAPYADTHSNTLADVAMKYYEEDLSSLDDKVPGAVQHQHLVTYTVAFGVEGSLNPDDYDLIHPPFPSWPSPNTNTRKIDDLWHAAVNGHGKYLNAANPDQLVDSLLNITADISRRAGTGASLSVNGDQFYEVIDGALRIFQSEYHSGTWWGDLKALKFDQNTDELLMNAPVWEAAQGLESRIQSLGHGNRLIATYNGVSGIPFRWNVGSLTAIQQKQVFPYFDPNHTAEEMINYIRGDRALDGVFRSRTKVLGDFVHSSAVYRDGVLYIGGNDGFLHAFLAGDADNGKELFAYAPALVFQNLRELADPAYGHKFFVDNTPFIKKMRNTTMLVGGLGKGGKGFYGLNITNASSIGSEADLSARVLWEYPKPPEVMLPIADTLEFQSGNGVDGRDVITDSDNRFTEVNGFEAGRFITVIGANCSTGMYKGTNDGTYKIEAVEADGSQIELPPGSLVGMCGNGENVIVTKSINDPGVGYSFARPIIVETNDSSLNSGDDMAGYVVLFGNGYSSETGTAILYVLNPVTGELLKKIDTGAGPLNGMSTPTPVDVNTDLLVDYVYAGDLQGNMWKFDFTSEDYNDWQVAFCANPDGSNHCKDTSASQPRPLFSTFSSQSITSAPDVTPHNSKIGYMVVFGTGKYLSGADIVSQTSQSLYGVWDWAPDELDSGYLGARIGSLEHPQLSNFTGNSLLRQRILWQGELTEDLNGDNTLSPEEDGNNNGVEDDIGYFRIATDFEADWSTEEVNVSIAGETIVYEKPLANMGWCFDLPGKISDGDSEDNDHDNVIDETGERSLGERVINDAIIRNGNAILISFGLTGGRCSAGAYSFLNERDVFSGGMVKKPALDINNSGGVNPDDKTIQWVDTTGDGTPDAEVTLYVTDRLFTTGRMHNPIFGQKKGPGIQGKNPEVKYMSDSSGTIQKQVESAEINGTYFWEQIQ